MVVEAEIFPAVLTCLMDQDEYVKKNCATLIREIAKHTPEVGKVSLKYGWVLCAGLFYCHHWVVDQRCLRQSASRILVGYDLFLL